MTIKDAKLTIALNSLAAVIGSASSLAAVMIIIALRVYSSYAYRITLYLAIVSLLDRILLGLEVLPANVDGPDNVTVDVKNGWEDACKTIGCIDQYFSLCKPLAVLWLCLYVFVLAAFRVQLQLIRHEVAGLLSVFVIPLFIVWIPFLHNGYGLTGTWCWIKDSCNGTHLQNSGFKLGVADGPVLLAHVTSLGLIAIIITVFCKGSLQTSYLQRCNQTVLKKLLPLLLYPALYSIAVAVSTAKDVYFTITKPVKGDDMFVAELVVVVLLQTFTVALPISLLLHSDVRGALRSTLCRKLKQKERTIQTTCSSKATIHITSQPYPATSQVVFITHSESDSDPLIITRHSGT